MFQAPVFCFCSTMLQKVVFLFCDTLPLCECVSRAEILMSPASRLFLVTFCLSSQFVVLLILVKMPTMLQKVAQTQKVEQKILFTFVHRLQRDFPAFWALKCFTSKPFSLLLGWRAMGCAKCNSHLRKKINHQEAKNDDTSDCNCVRPWPRPG